MRLTDDEIAGQLEQIPLNRWAIRVEPVRDYDAGERPDADISLPLVEVTTEHRAEIAEEFARYLHIESPYDFVLFDRDLWRRSRDDDALRTFLIDSSSHKALMPIAVGAAGCRRVSGTWVLTWVWIHPFERARGRDTWTCAWKQLEVVLDSESIQIEGPVSKAMRGWMVSQGLGDRECEIRPKAG